MAGRYKYYHERYSNNYKYQYNDQEEEDDDNFSYVTSRSMSSTRSYCNYNPTRLLPNLNRHEEYAEECSSRPYSPFADRRYTGYRDAEEDVSVTDLTQCLPEEALVDLTEYTTTHEGEGFYLEDQRYSQYTTKYGHPALQSKQEKNQQQLLQRLISSDDTNSEDGIFESDDRLSRTRRESDLVDLSTESYIDLTQVPSHLDNILDIVEKDTREEDEVQSLPPLSQYNYLCHTSSSNQHEHLSPMSLPNMNGSSYPATSTRRTSADLVLPSFERETGQPLPPVKEDFVVLPAVLPESSSLPRESPTVIRVVSDVDDPPGVLESNPSLLTMSKHKTNTHPEPVVVDPPGVHPIAKTIRTNIIDTYDNREIANIIASRNHAKENPHRTADAPTRPTQDCPAILLRQLSNPVPPGSTDLEIANAHNRIPEAEVTHNRHYQEIIIIDSGILQSSSSSSSSNGRESRDPTEKASNLMHRTDTTTSLMHQVLHRPSTTVLPPQTAPPTQTTNSIDNPIRTWMPSQANIDTVMRGMHNEPTTTTDRMLPHDQDDEEKSSEESVAAESLLSHLLDDSVHSQSIPSDRMLQESQHIVPTAKTTNAQLVTAPPAVSNSSSFAEDLHEHAAPDASIFTPKQTSSSFELDRQDTLSSGQVYCDNPPNPEEAAPSTKDSPNAAAPDGTMELELQRSIPNEMDDEEEEEEDQHDQAIRLKLQVHSTSTGLDAEATYAAFCFSDTEEKEAESEVKESEHPIAAEAEAEALNSKLGSLVHLWEDRFPQKAKETAFHASWEEETDDNEVKPNQESFSAQESTLPNNSSVVYNEVVTVEEVVGEILKEEAILDEMLEAYEIENAEEGLQPEEVFESLSSIERKALSSIERKVRFSDDIYVNVYHPFESCPVENTVDAVADVWSSKMQQIADPLPSTKEKEQQEKLEESSVDATINTVADGQSIKTAEVAASSNSKQNTDDADEHVESMEEKKEEEEEQSSIDVVIDVWADPAVVDLVDDERETETDNYIGEVEEAVMEHWQDRSDERETHAEIQSSDSEEIARLSEHGEGEVTVLHEEVGQEAGKGAGTDEREIDESGKASAVTEDTPIDAFADVWDRKMSKIADAEDAYLSNQQNNEPFLAVSGNEVSGAQPDQSLATNDMANKVNQEVEPSTASECPVEGILAPENDGAKERNGEPVGDSNKDDHVASTDEVVEDNEMPEQDNPFWNFLRSSPPSNNAETEADETSTEGDPLETPTTGWSSFRPDISSFISDLKSSALLSSMQSEKATDENELPLEARTSHDLEPLSFCDGGSGVHLPQTYNRVSEVNGTGSDDRKELVEEEPNADSESLQEQEEDTSELGSTVGSEDQFCGNANLTHGVAVTSEDISALRQGVKDDDVVKEGRADSCYLDSILPVQDSTLIDTVEDEIAPEGLQDMEDETEAQESTSDYYYDQDDTEEDGGMEDDAADHNSTSDCEQDKTEEDLRDEDDTEEQDLTSSYDKVDAKEDAGMEDDTEDQASISKSDQDIENEVTTGSEVVQDEATEKHIEDHEPTPDHHEANANVQESEAPKDINEGSGVTDGEDAGESVAAANDAKVESEETSPTKSSQAPADMSKQEAVIENIADRELKSDIPNDSLINLSFDNDSKGSTVSLLQDSPPESPETPGATLNMEELQVLVTALMTHEYGFEFSKPLDLNQFPDYAEETSKYKAIDLGTILRNLINGDYETILDFQSDVNMVFTFRMKHSKKGTKVHKMAKKMKKKFEKDLLKLLDDLENKLNG